MIYTICIGYISKILQSLPKSGGVEDMAVMGSTGPACHDIQKFTWCAPKDTNTSTE